MQIWMTGEKAKFTSHQPGVCIAIMGVRKVSQKMDHNALVGSNLCAFITHCYRLPLFGL